MTYNLTTVLFDFSIYKGPVLGHILLFQARDSLLLYVYIYSCQFSV